jgi:arabinose-5-phosphate isomerase
MGGGSGRSRLMAAKKSASFEMTAGECMTRNPVTIPSDEVASAALNLMEKRKITSVVVADGDRRVLGVVHIHDLWTLQLF